MNANNEILNSLCYTPYEEDFDEIIEGYDEAVRLEEVATNGDLTLCEVNDPLSFLDETVYIIDEVIPRLFPDFTPDTHKKYAIIGNNGIYME